MTGKIFLATLALSVSMNGLAQFVKLELSVHVGSLSTIDDSYVVIMHHDDTVFRKKTDELGYPETIDSLLPGKGYKLEIFDKSYQPGPVFIRTFEMEKEGITELDVSVYMNMEFTDYEDTLTNDSRMETQLFMGYNNNKWVMDDPALTSNASIGITQCGWFPVTRNFGLLTGGGVGLTHSSIAGDTTFMDQPDLKKRYEYYNYFDLLFMAAFRFSTGSQLVEYTSPKFTIDIGASYNLPIAFKHIARYAGNQKFMKGGLHQFTDCRVFVNIGYSPCLFFAEYRLFDFLLGSYPELPKWTFGLKVAIPE
jgi:hypothetical protein